LVKFAEEEICRTGTEVSEEEQASQSFLQRLRRLQPKWVEGCA